MNEAASVPSGLVHRSDSMIPFNQKKCYKDLLGAHSSASNGLERIANLRASINAQTNPNLLICHLPRIYRPDPINGIFSNAIGIVINGRDLKEVSFVNGELEFHDILDMDGYYELKTEIK